MYPPRELHIRVSSASSLPSLSSSSPHKSHAGTTKAQQTLREFPPVHLVLEVSLFLKRALPILIGRHTFFPKFPSFFPFASSVSLSKSIFRSPSSYCRSLKTWLIGFYESFCCYLYILHVLLFTYIITKSQDTKTIVFTKNVSTPPYIGNLKLKEDLRSRSRNHGRLST